jgi:hypothetical protein
VSQPTGRLAGLGAAGHEDVQAGDNAGLEEARRLRVESAQPDEILQMVSAHDEFADVDVPVVARDVGMTTWSRDPSLRVASTNGLERSNLLT